MPKAISQVLLSTLPVNNELKEGNEERTISISNIRWVIRRLPFLRLHLVSLRSSIQPAWAGQWTAYAGSSVSMLEKVGFGVGFVFGVGLLVLV